MKKRVRKKQNYILVRVGVDIIGQPIYVKHWL